MSRMETKVITVIVPGKGATMPFTVTSATSITDLLRATGCPDWYSLSMTRRGPAVVLSNRRLLDVVHHKGKLYLSPPTNAHQLDLPFADQTPGDKCVRLPPQSCKSECGNGAAEGQSAEPPRNLDRLGACQ